MQINSKLKKIKVSDNIRIKDKTDVVEDFDYSKQSPDYITAYKKWRKNPDNPYAYNYIQNKNEITFTDDQGFIHTLPEEKESETLKKICYLLGTVVIIYFFIEFVLSKPLVEILDFIGVNIHNSFSNYSIYGGRTEVMIVIIVVNLLKYCVPLFILHKAIKMPLKVSTPLSLQSPKDLFLCIALGVAVGVVTSIPRAYSDTTREIFTFFHGGSDALSLMNQSQLIIYMFFDIVIFSILTEILFHGVIFQVLRQFGDLFAVIVSASFSAITAHDIYSIPSVFAISLVSAIAILRSGTIFTAFSIRIINKIYLFLLTIIELSYTNMSLERNSFMIGSFLIGISITILIWNTTDKKIVIAKNLKTFLTAKQKVSIIFTTLPSFTVILLSVIIIISDLLS